jgi:hypothetical protein
MTSDKLATGIVEDIDVGVESHTEEIVLDAYVSRDNDTIPTDYNVSIDEQTKQIVVTPKNPKCFFTTDETDDCVKVELYVDMLSDTNDFTYDTNVDNIGQLIISPKNDDTEFISVATKNNLNLITAEDEDGPYSKEVCEEEIAFLTNNYSLSYGTISTHFEQERDIATELLSAHYEYIDIGSKVKDGEESWEISYSTPKNQPELTEDAEIGDEEGDTWQVKYELGVTESLNESDDQVGGEDKSVTVIAPDAETALRYAEQHAKMKREENPEWGSAQVVALTKQ